MAEINEVYRIYVGAGWKDVNVTSASGDVINFTISEVENISGTEVDETGSVDLSAVENDKLYDKDGVTATEEAPE